MSDDMKLYMEKGLDAVIAKRSERGERLAAKFADLPKGLSWEEFLQHEDVADLDLDFITAHQMFEAYSR